jgi:hypothetical protein
MKEVCIPQIKYFLSLKFISLVCDLRQVWLHKRSNDNYMSYKKCTPTLIDAIDTNKPSHCQHSKLQLKR